jgi:hypothetical protein
MSDEVNTQRSLRKDNNVLLFYNDRFGQGLAGLDVGVNERC